MPWEEAQSHASLFMQRERATTKEEQNRLAGQEHRAFAREAVADNPVMAIPISVGIPVYQGAKVLGVTGSRSDPSVSQAVEGLKGVGEGLVQAVSTPWEEAKLEAKRFSDSMSQKVEKAVTSVKSLLPWQEAAQASEKAKQGGSTSAPPIISPEPVKQAGKPLIPTEEDMKKMAMFSPVEIVAREAQMTSPEFLAEMKAEIDKTKDPAKKKILQTDYDAILKRKKK